MKSNAVMLEWLIKVVATLRPLITYKGVIGDANDRDKLGQRPYRM